MARSGTQWTRDGRALVAAALLHALSLATLRHLATPAASLDLRAATKPVPEEPQYELDWSEQPSAAPDTSETRVVEELRGREQARSPAIRPSASHPPAPTQSMRVASTDTSDTSEANDNDAPSAEEASDASIEGTPTAPIDLGVGPEGWRRWAMNPTGVTPESEHAPGREPRFKAPAKSTTGGLLEGLEEHDRAVGLTPSGRVRSALFNAAHSDVAPQLGVASFRVTVRNDGSVEIAVHGATDSDKQWQQVAERAAADLRKNPPRIPPPRAGARILVEIKAESVLPNGAKVANLHGTRIEVDPPRIRSLEESKKALKDKNPTAETFSGPDPTMPLAVDVPGVYLTHAGKVCTVRAGVTPFGLALSGGCDPSNIGAKAARMVHTRIREETLF